jgi:hypothetical protein
MTWRDYRFSIHVCRHRAQLRWQLAVKHPRIAESRNEPTGASTASLLVRSVFNRGCRAASLFFRCFISEGCRLADAFADLEPPQLRLMPAARTRMLRQ